MKSYFKRRRMVLISEITMIHYDDYLLIIETFNSLFLMERSNAKKFR